MNPQKFLFRIKKVQREGNGALPIMNQQERITLVDSFRGFGVLGILLVNIAMYADSVQRFIDLRVLNEFSGPNYYAWWIVYGFIEGTVKAVFSMLFGASVLLFLGRLSRKTAPENYADCYYRRLISLLFFGMINAYFLLWPGDILYQYALCGMFLYPIRNLRARYLVIMAIVGILFLDIRHTHHLYNEKSIMVRGEIVEAILRDNPSAELTRSQESDKENWQGHQEKRTAENLFKAVERERQEYQKSYFGLFSYIKEVNRTNHAQVMSDFFLRDVLIFMILGMALLKLSVFTGQQSMRLYWLLFSAGYGIGIFLSYWKLNSLLSVNFEPVLLADKMVISLNMVRKTSLGLGHIALLVLLYKYNLFRFLMRWFAKVGRMAFTNYLMQSIICGLVFYGFGAGLYGKLERFEWYYVVLCVWAFQIVFSIIWLSYFQIGPFEWIWRCITFWKLQPIKRTNKNKIPDPVVSTA
jgi:uncharacterized protein